MSRILIALAFFFPMTLVLGACSSTNEQEELSPSGNTNSGNVNSSDFELYEIGDSARIVFYEDGLQLYTVLEGPGEFPVDGMTILVHYHGLLGDGSVFDSSYDRDEPLKVRLGTGKLIPGFEYSVKQLRMGSKAIAFIPPELGYGGKEDVPNVPPNSDLIFHIEVLGTF